MNRRAILCIAVLLALAAGGCRSYDYKDLEITSEHDRELDFFRFKTWAWAPQATAQIADPRVHELTAHTRLKRNLASEILPCGLRPAGNEKPDLLVRYEIWLVEPDAAAKPASGADGGRTHDRAGLRIEMINARTDKVVWAATAVATVDFRATLEERDRRVGRAVREMMRRYPLYEGR